MSRGGYHNTAAYRRGVKRGKEELGGLLGLFALPFYIILLPLKWIFGSKKKHR